MFFPEPGGGPGVGLFLCLLRDTLIEKKVMVACTFTVLGRSKLAFLKTFKIYWELFHIQKGFPYLSLLEVNLYDIHHFSHAGSI